MPQRAVLDSKQRPPASIEPSRSCSRTVGSGLRRSPPDVFEAFIAGTKAARGELTSRELPKNESPAAFVISANLRRRHLTPSQRAMLPADFEPALRKETEAKQKAGKGADGSGGRGHKKTLGQDCPNVSDDGRAREQAGALLAVSGRAVSEAKQIEAADPTLADRVRDGRTYRSRCSATAGNRGYRSRCSATAARTPRCRLPNQPVPKVDPARRRSLGGILARRFRQTAARRAPAAVGAGSPAAVESRRRKPAAAIPAK